MEYVTLENRHRARVGCRVEPVIRLIKRVIKYDDYIIIISRNSICRLSSSTVEADAKEKRLSN